MGTNNVFQGNGSNKPDIVLFDQNSQQAFIVEISHPRDIYLDICFASKCLKYGQLADAFRTIGYKCLIVSLIISSSGIVHKNFTTGLKILGFSKPRAKDLAKYLSVSVMIGSHRIWRRRFDARTINNRER